MWNRKILKEEAKKVFTFNAKNYWLMVLVALIITMLSGGVGGAFGGGVGSACSALISNIVKNNSQHKYQYQRMSSVTTDKDTLIVKDENGKETKIHIHSTPEINGDYGTWDEDVDIDLGDYLEEPFDEDLPHIYGSNDDLTGLYGIAGASIAIAIVVILIVSVVITVFVMAFKAFLINPLILGCKSFFLNTYDSPAALKDLGNGFKNQYMRNVGTLLLRDIFVMLWSLLLIVPGIIKAYEYRMIPYLIAEKPNMTYKEAFAKSKEMMMGNKWNAFVLDLSFLGWFILNSLTCGLLGLFYVNPYYHATDANLYRAIKMGGDTGFVSQQYSASTPVTPEGATVSEKAVGDVLQP